MDSKFVAPVRIPINSSRWLLAGITLAHSGAFCILWQLTLPYWVKIVLLPLIASSLAVSCYRHLYISADSLKELLLTSEDEWLLTTRNGKTYEGRLLHGHYVHPGLVVLPFATGNRRLTVVITPEMIDEDVFRRLRVRLRYRKKSV